MTKKLFIFDLDGTLVDAYAAIAISFNFTMKRLGYPVVRESVIRKAVGWGDENLLRPFVMKKDLKKALRIYRAHHAISLKKHVRWLSHALALLRCLKTKGAKLAIASNRPTRFTGIILKVLGGRALFDKVLCADKLKAGKPDPLILNEIVRALKVPRQEALYVGDMVIDVQTGKRARIDTAAVATGSSSQAELRKAKPTYLYKDLRYLKSACGLIKA